MQMFLLNLLLAAIYLALTDEVSFLNVVIGFAIGAAAVQIYVRTTSRPSYFGKGVRLVRFVGYFLYILAKANLQVAKEILTPGLQMTPRIIRYPVHGLTPVQITTLASAITLTPGTLSADIDDAGEYLYIHAMYAQDREQAVAELDDLKHRLMDAVFRP